MLLESDPALSARTRLALEARGHSVVCVTSEREANRHPCHFDCGVFGNDLMLGRALALAGWLLAENRLHAVVFFGEPATSDVRSRASNLGAWVARAASADQVCDVVEAQCNGG